MWMVLLKIYGIILLILKEAKEISVNGVGGLIGGAESQYTLVVNGSNFEEIQTASQEIVSALKEIDGMAELGSSIEGEEPEIEIDLNEEKLAENGLMPAMVGQGLRNLINGDVVTNMTVEDEKTDVKLRLKMDDITSLDELGKQEINNMMGMPVAL